MGRIIDRRQEARDKRQETGLIGRAVNLYLNIKINMKRHNFKKLQIWKDSMELINHTYLFTGTFPDFEKFGLRTQMNRCAVSIASNISEGSSKRSDNHFIKLFRRQLRFRL